MRMVINARDFRSLDKALLALEPKHAKDAMRKGLRAGAKIVLKSAKEKAPVATGALKKALRVVTGKRSKHRIVYNVSAGKTIELSKGDRYYAHMVEYGTSRKQANPFIRPAFDEHEKRVSDEIINSTWKAIEQGWKK